MTTPPQNKKPELPESLRKAREAARGQKGAAPSGEGAGGNGNNPSQSGEHKSPDAPTIFPVSRAREEEQAAQAAAEEAKKAEAERIGANIKGKGIYLGPIDLSDRKGRLVGKFNLYAAPTDLTRRAIFSRKRLRAEFDDVCRHLAGLKNFHGHDGYQHSFVDLEEDLYESIQIGRYRGQWFVPTMEMMRNHIYPNQNKKDMVGSFATSEKPFAARFYWTCTETVNATYVDSLNMVNGNNLQGARVGGLARSTRCVRLEPRPGR